MYNLGWMPLMPLWVRFRNLVEGHSKSEAFQQVKVVHHKLSLFRNDLKMFASDNILLLKLPIIGQKTIESSHDGLDLLH